MRMYKCRGYKDKAVNGGFSLIELMVVVAIVGIIAVIAVPAYQNNIVKTKRKAAEACLSQFAVYMERYYTSNLKYDQDPSGNANTKPTLNCETDSHLNTAYTFSIPAMAASAYTVKATPVGTQASRDSGCGNLTLNESGIRSVSGSNSVDSCW